MFSSIRYLKKLEVNLESLQGKLSFWQIGSFFGGDPSFVYSFSISFLCLSPRHKNDEVAMSFRRLSAQHPPSHHFRSSIDCVTPRGSWEPNVPRSMAPCYDESFDRFRFCDDDMTLAVWLFIGSFLSCVLFFHMM